MRVNASNATTKTIGRTPNSLVFLKFNNKILTKTENHIKKLSNDKSVNIHLLSCAFKTKWLEMGKLLKTSENFITDWFLPRLNLGKLLKLLESKKFSEVLVNWKLRIKNNLTQAIISHCHSFQANPVRTCYLHSLFGVQGEPCTIAPEMDYRKLWYFRYYF